ncbi:MAG TPA: preprotein translocase subunit YajC [Nocardioides sp.]|nr:preprotein translocase subunit YajC [Nocardioides sp.]
MESLASLLPFLLIILVFWFLVIRPARNQQKKLADTQASVAVGSEVMLGSGFYGRVVEIGEETLQLELAPGTTVRVARQAVVRVVTAEDRVEERPEGSGPDDVPGPQA